MPRPAGLRGCCSMIPTEDLLRLELRANPGYELVLVDRLAPAEQEALAPLRAQGDLFGVLRPRPGSLLPPRSVDHETALLFYALQQPGALPAYVCDELGEAAFTEINRLIADAVIEIRDEGGFVGGPAALEPRRGAPNPPSPANPETPENSALAELSPQALRPAHRRPAR